MFLIVSLSGKKKQNKPISNAKIIFCLSNANENVLILDSTSYCKEHSKYLSATKNGWKLILETAQKCTEKFSNIEPVITHFRFRTPEMTQVCL